MAETTSPLSDKTTGKPSNDDNYHNARTQNGTKVLLETDKERKERLWSLWIIYFTMFLISLGFSVVLTGVWPFLDKVRSNILQSLFLFNIYFSLLV